MIKVMNIKCKDQLLYLLFLFFTGSFLGFLWEVLVYWVQHSEPLINVVFELRGFLYGTWVPIYGVGIVILYLLVNKMKENLLILFFMSGCICSFVEYLTSWILEILFHLTLWDYSTLYLNINGRICLLSFLFFAIAGIVIAKWLEPIFKRLYRMLPMHVHTQSLTLLSVMFLLDFIFSLLTKYN